MRTFLSLIVLLVAIIAIVMVGLIFMYMAAEGPVCPEGKFKYDEKAIVVNGYYSGHYFYTAKRDCTKDGWAYPTDRFGGQIFLESNLRKE